jgi:hypothetical protein
MNNQDQHWQNLLALSAPTFNGDEVPPFGFATRTLARLREEESRREVVERIGFRALFAAVAVLAVTVGAVVAVESTDRGDLEPGVRSLIQVENVQVS